MSFKETLNQQLENRKKNVQKEAQAKILAWRLQKALERAELKKKVCAARQRICAQHDYLLGMAEASGLMNVLRDAADVLHTPLEIGFLFSPKEPVSPDREICLQIPSIPDIYFPQADYAISIRTLKMSLVWNEKNQNHIGQSYDYLDVKMDLNGAVIINGAILPIFRWQWERNPSIMDKAIARAVLRPAHYSSSNPLSAP